MPRRAKVWVEMPNPQDVLYSKMAGRGTAHLDLADALKVMKKEKNFSYCYYKMAYICALYSCAYSRLLVKYLLARSRNLLWPLDEEDIK